MPDNGSDEPKHAAYCCVALKCCVLLRLHFSCSKHSVMSNDKITGIVKHYI